MTTPSPAPKRRRRAPAQESPEPGAVPKAAQQEEPTAPLPSTHDNLTTPAPKPPFLAFMPTPLRLLLIALCSIVLVTCAVAVTRDYLARQEERRRLEAEAAERAQHPLFYADLITQYAAQQRLDPALVAAVILCESSYNPQAQSRYGARGLMQLMEDTAAWIAHNLGEDANGYTFDMLYDPQTNIRFGTWYLGYLSNRFSGDEKKMICAYHAGQGNVDSWLSNPAYSSDGVTLDVIPTEDTAAYASRVLRARDVYRKYYFQGAEPTAAPVD